MMTKDEILNSKMVIYCFTNKINGKQYIGQTINKLKQRLAGHIHRSKNTISLIGQAIAKYGIQNFKLKILYFAKTKEELNEKEKEYISKFNSLSPNGYNIRIGGDNESYSTEHLEKLRISHNTPEYILKCKVKFQNQDFLTSLKEKLKVSLNKPEVIAKKKEAARLNYLNPKYIENLHIATCNEFCIHKHLDFRLLQEIEIMLELGMSIRGMGKFFETNQIFSLKGKALKYYLIRDIVNRNLK